MTDKKTAKADSVELDETELDNITGGETEELFGAYHWKAEISGIKKQLTEKAGIRVGKRFDQSSKHIVLQAGDSEI